MPELTGGCTCGHLRYTLTLTLPSPSDEARTTLCHCSSCKRAFGGAFGLTAKVPKDTFRLSQGTPKVFAQDNGVHREFCFECGVFVCEYGEAVKDIFRYVCVGTLDEGPDALPPQGEFFTSQRCKWMPQIPDTFQRRHVKD